MRNLIGMLGVVLWIGTLSPEIFTDMTAGCIFDEDGNELDQEQAQEFMKVYFYRDGKNDNTSPELEFKFGIMKLFDGD